MDRPHHADAARPPRLSAARAGRQALTVLPFVFFVSGFAALAYQIVWQRLLVMFSGSDVESATIIVAAFMAGLGCGSAAGGRIADRLSAAGSIATFAAAELGIGLFGAFSATLYYDVLYRQLGHMSWGLETRAAILFLNLVWPTFLMGASLPLLVRAVTYDIHDAAANSGTLYAVNTMGGAVGAFVTTWWLLPAFGLRGTLQRCAVLNFLIVIAVLPLALRAARGLTSQKQARSRSGADQIDDVAVGHEYARFTTWALLYGLAGFVALSLEIVWFRLLGVFLKSSAYVFGTLLAHYLSGLGVGAAAGAIVAARTKNPARMFVAAQVGIGLCAGLGVLVLTLLVHPAGGWPWLAAYAASPEPIDVQSAVWSLLHVLNGTGSASREVWTLYVWVPGMMILPPTILMGAGFPLLQKAVQTDLRRVGRRVGLLLLANIVGSGVGTFATGWFALEWFGAAGTLKALLLVCGLFPIFGAVVLWRREPRHVIAAAAAVAAIVLMAAGLPDGELLWGRLHGAVPRSIVHGEDGSGTSLLKVEPSQFLGRAAVFANGTSQSRIPFGGIHTVIGALPAFLLREPRTAAVIGLGSGDTVFAVAGRSEISRIRCIEIIRPQLSTLRAFNRLYPYRALDTVLTDRRIEHVYGDGRLHIMQSGAKYDLIEADALKPASAYSGNLYSDAYFTLLRDHLSPGGIAVSWAPTERVHDTFVTVFPYVLSYGDVVLGSASPIAFDAPAIRERLARPAVPAHFDQAGVDIRSLLEPYLTRGPRAIGPDDDRSRLRDINTDVFPKDEFGVPRSPAAGH